MHRIFFAFGLCGLLFAFLGSTATNREGRREPASRTSGGDPRVQDRGRAGKASGADAARPREAASQQRTGGRSRQHRRE